jgi:hypothetical protein
MLQHFPKKYNKRIPEFLSGACLYFLTTKPKICKKVYFGAKKMGQGRF